MSQADSFDFDSDALASSVHGMSFDKTKPGVKPSRIMDILKLTIPEKKSSQPIVR